MAQHLYNSQDQVPLLKKIKYLNIWISECAPWLDMFDQERHFGIQVAIIARRSPAVLYALLALAARQTERHGGSAASSQDSLELYSRAISSLAPSINARDPPVLITACILCVLEMMSVSPRDWRRHSEGCAALLENSGVNGFSAGLLQAVFWCYARMDLCAAIIAEGGKAPRCRSTSGLSLTHPSPPRTDYNINNSSSAKGSLRRAPPFRIRTQTMLCTCAPAYAIYLHGVQDTWSSARTMPVLIVSTSYNGRACGRNCANGSSDDLYRCNQYKKSTRRTRTGISPKSCSHTGLQSPATSSTTPRVSS